METNSQKIKYSKYIADVFYSLMDFEKDVPISAVLYSAMENTKYLKSTGKTRNTKQLSDDIKVFYDKLDIENISSFYQIQRVLLGDRFDFSVVCQIAFYLGVDVNDLTNSTLTIEQIETEQNTHFMKDKSNVDWNAYDKDTAPILEKTLRDIYEGKTNEQGRPKRVSERMAYRIMNIPQHRLEILPKFKAVFDKYTETYEENWAGVLSGSKKTNAYVIYSNQYFYKNHKKIYNSLDVLCCIIKSLTGNNLCSLHN